MGRPLLAPEQRKNWTHSVNFYEEEYHAVSRIAARENIAISKFLRDAAMEKVEREKESTAV